MCQCFQVADVGPQYSVGPSPKGFVCRRRGGPAFLPPPPSSPTHSSLLASEGIPTIWGFSRT